MVKKRTRLFEMKHVDLRQARLMGLALQSIGEDLVPLVGGSELNDDLLAPSIWTAEDEHEKSEAANKLFRELRVKLEELGFRALVFAASENYLGEGLVDHIVDHG